MNGLAPLLRGTCMSCARRRRVPRLDELFVLKVLVQSLRCIVAMFKCAKYEETASFTAADKFLD